jgi:general secretion pathway protein M
MSLRERIGRLEPRERRLLNLMFAVFIVLVLVVVPLGLAAVTGARKSENEQLRATVEAIESGRQAVAQAAAQRESITARYRTPAPVLASLLDEMARQSGLEIPESQDRAPVPHGKQFEERSTKILLRKVGMLGLVQFMERIENSPYPVIVSRLNIRKRSTEPDSFDVEMIVSAFDRKAADKKGGATTPPAKEPG